MGWAAANLTQGTTYPTWHTYGNTKEKGQTQGRATAADVTGFLHIGEHGTFSKRYLLMKGRVIVFPFQNKNHLFVLFKCLYMLNPHLQVIRVKQGKIYK